MIPSAVWPLDTQLKPGKTATIPAPSSSPGLTR